MDSVERREVWRVSQCDYRGHESTGDRPVLAMSPAWFNRLNAANNHNRAIIVPLTNRPHDCAIWWETTIGATGSTALPADVRTVLVKDLSPTQCGLATKCEMENLLTIMSALIMGEDEHEHFEYRRGEVWNVKGGGGSEREVLVLHYNPGNAMAMTMACTNKPRDASNLVLPVQSDAVLAGYSILASHVRSLSTECRFLNRIGEMPADEVDEAGNIFIKLLSPLTNP